MIAAIKTSIIIIMLSVVASSAYMAKCYHDARQEQQRQTVILQQMYEQIRESDVVFKVWGNMEAEDDGDVK